MNLADIVAALKADEALHSLIEDRIYFDKADINSVPCIAYTFSPITDNRIERTDRLTIMSFAIGESKTAKCLEIDSRVRKILLSYGDTSSVSSILQAYVNGGSTPVDITPEIKQVTTFYTIISRSE